jgi:hypothetical protein
MIFSALMGSASNPAAMAAIMVDAIHDFSESMGPPCFSP